MKYITSLGLLVVTVAAMMAFAGSASATAVTGPSGEEEPAFHFIVEGPHVEIHNSIVNIKCEVTIQGGITVSILPPRVRAHIKKVEFINCTDEWVVDVSSNGSMEISATGGSGHGVGTVSSTGMKITATRAGLSCVYETNNTPIGTLTGGNPATLNLSGSIPRVGGSFLCGGSTAALTGSLVSTSTLKIDP